MPHWTNEQLQAIHARNDAVLVSAGAGSGKTAVLVARIMEMILQDSVPVDRMLVVTFTKAAAAEMRQRLNDALQDALAADPGNSSLRLQLTLLPQANICTLDSFCAQVQRTFFYLLDQEPDLRVGEESQIELCRRQALEDVFEEGYRSRDEDLMYLAARFTTTRSDEALRQMILSTQERLSSLPDPEAWQAQVLAMFDLDPSTSPWAKSILQEVAMKAGQARSAFLRCRNIALGGELTDKFADDADSLIRLCESLAQAQSLDAARELATAKRPRKPAKNKQTDALTADFYGNAREVGIEILKSIPKLFPADCSPEALLRAKAAVQALFRLHGKWKQRFSQLKNQNGIQEFSDVALNALSLLRREEVAAYYRSRIDWVFLDEYQDTNRLQEAIVHAIRSDRLFMVGDMKQSIYRFRLADPTLFSEKYQTYDGQEDAPHLRIDLNRNFRSHPQVLAFLNGLFRLLMSREVGDIPYDEAQQLIPGAEMPACDVPVDLHIADKKGEGDLSDELQELSALERESLLIARLIRDAVGTPVYDPKLDAQRPLRYRDFAILMRSPRSRAPTVLQTLLSAGIPAYADTSGALTDAPEVQVMENLLKVLEDPRRDVPLISVLHSRFFGMSMEQLCALRVQHPTGRFWDAFAHAAQQGGEAAEALEQINAWRALAARTDLPELMLQVMEYRDFYSRLGLMPGGAQRQANLMLMVECARRMQGTALYTLTNFLDTFHPEGGSRQEGAQVLGEQDDVVRIMSIHKSKGLQFPVVIAAGLGSRFNLTDKGCGFLTHPVLGAGLPDVDPAARVKRTSLPFAAILAQTRREEISEEMRLLYVALTRAQNRLLLTGCADLDSLGKRVLQPLTPAAVAGADSMLTWVAMAAYRSLNGRDLNRDGIPDDAGVELPFRLHLHSGAELLAPLPRGADDMMDALIRRAQSVPPADLGWQYPHPPAAPVFGLTASGGGEGEEALLPRFLSGTSGMTAAQKGTLLHTVLCKLELDGPCAEVQAKGLLQREFFTKEQLAQVDVSVLDVFLQSPLAARMRSASTLLREKPFQLLMEDGAVLQGIIDCCFLEADGWVLVDYKSDHLTPENRAGRLEHHARQLDYYARALTALTGKPVKERLLYLLNMKETVAL